jgi:hypothetical protein
MNKNIVTHSVTGTVAVILGAVLTALYPQAAPQPAADLAVVQTKVSALEISQDETNANLEKLTDVVIRIDKNVAVIMRGEK